MAVHEVKTSSRGTQGGYQSRQPHGAPAPISVSTGPVGTDIVHLASIRALIELKKELKVRKQS